MTKMVSLKYMAKMHTLKTEKSMMESAVPSMPLPSFRVTVKDLPEIKSWKVGEKYPLMVEVEMVEMSKSEYDPRDPLSARLKIHKIGVEEMDDEATKQAKRGHV